MKEDRLFYSINPELKPLFAHLKRAKIGEYLVADSFNHLLVELDWDDEWRACLKECQINPLSHAADYEEAFFILMNLFYDDEGLDDGSELLVDIILDFLKWRSEPFDIKKISSELHLLYVHDSIIKRLVSKAKKVGRKKIETKPGSLNHQPRTNKVFIIHGHDEVSRLHLEKIIKDDFNLEVVVLQESPNEGLDTVISKFERLANQCSIAFALFTPDDKLSDKDYRARQNVILELGYFLGRDQGAHNRKIVILKKGNVEIPSDIKGVVYYQFAASVKEVYSDLQKQLRYWKVIS